VQSYTKAKLIGICRLWLTDCRGQFALVLSILAPIALGLVGGAIDLMVFMNHRAELQATADAAVLAVAREASLKGWSETTALLGQ
jgi:Flp pilus assembly protein TadG